MENFEVNNLNDEELKYYALFMLNMKYDDHIGVLLNKRGNPNLTVCPYCRVDDFVHVESCKILQVYNNEIINNNI